MKILNKLIERKLTVRDGIVLIRLSSHKDIRASFLTCPFISASNLNKIVYKLVERGYATVRQDDHDQRAIILNATQAGKDVVRGH